MKCLLIIAGKGSRLKSLSDSKPLTSILDVPLVERVIRAALESGVDGFYAVVGYRGEQVRSFLEGLAGKINVPITVIDNPEWEKANGLSVLKAKEFLSEPFLLLMGDHLFDPDITRKMIDHSLAGDEVVLAVDHNLKNPMVDLDDVTRVMEDKGLIQNIGKGIDGYNCFDTGIFLCTPALFSALEESVRVSGDDSLSGGIRVLAKDEKVRVMSIDGLFWIDIDDPERYRKAESYLNINS
ncbi:MAG: NTP transferase domain-containing protein [Nitrospinae bacterium]|nr:NTP transferase domain-containing protein [Nitrospinota bacterium]MZH45653.1 NTP transferase domain-containing protein [Nitrospinota bacterium]